MYHPNKYCTLSFYCTCIPLTLHETTATVLKLSIRRCACKAYGNRYTHARGPSGLEVDLVVDAKTAFTWYDAK